MAKTEPLYYRHVRPSVRSSVHHRSGQPSKLAQRKSGITNDRCRRFDENVRNGSLVVLSETRSEWLKPILFLTNRNLFLTYIDALVPDIKPIVFTKVTRRLETAARRSLRALPIKRKSFLCIFEEQTNRQAIREMACHLASAMAVHTRNHSYRRVTGLLGAPYPNPITFYMNHEDSEINSASRAGDATC
ncbi:hypothetical protein EVAR_88661_1 [Eumeta japonica]|uniref:Uncharacterized protein n=1 Tax=Eumeta variegata TaxID=151549 RepID=A0A4C1YBB3_EUMVA|nr:hypothetical protein EVAR_88661_1 [Eumeta japonica]